MILFLVVGMNSSPGNQHNKPIAEPNALNFASFSLHFDFVFCISLYFTLNFRERKHREIEREGYNMEMDGEKIGMVLVRASELRSKIANSIHKNPTQNGGIKVSSSMEKTAENEEQAVDDDKEEEEDVDALLSICDAFDSLESHLHSLQTLQQQQQYEREAVIGDIENSRKMLLKKLGEYKGEHIDIIQEAEVFAGMKVEHDTDLLLPPYPTRSHHLENNQFSRFSYSHRHPQNGYNGSEITNNPDNNQPQNSPNKVWGGLRFLVHSTAKTMFTLVGVITILKFAGFEPKISKKGANLNGLTLYQQPNIAKKNLIEQCPPGKVAVMEGGEVRCIVKERVEIPFDLVAENPDVNYGCG